MYGEEHLDKEVKINKKTKMKTLKQVIDICLKKGRPFNIHDEGLETYSDNGDEVFFTFEDFGKNHTVKDATLDYDHDGVLLSEVYYTKRGKKRSNDFPVEFADFFVKFPKLTKAQKKAPPLPPEPEVLAILPVGEGHKYHDFKHLDNNTIVVGCHEFDMEQAENIFKFLGGVLNYDLED